MRLQKYLSRAGVASRRQSEKLIKAGRVRVNGSVVTELGFTVDPERVRVKVDDRLVELRVTEWIALHKPPGYACTRHDPAGRPTIYELILDRWRHLYHVGRLDFMSEGLLLLSNEGDVVHRLLHPSSAVQRVYEVTLLGPVDGDLPRRLEDGVELEDGLAAAQRARWLAGAASRAPRVEIVLTEGRNREIRRMLAALDVKIRRLRRVRFGPIELGDLVAGEAREVTPREREALSRAAEPRGAG